MTRYVNNRFIIFGMLLLSVILPVAAPGQMIPAGIQVKFQGDSTLHGFAGTVEHASITNSRSPGGHDITEVHLPVRKMKTGNNTRDNRMYRMFDAENFPDITGTMDARNWLEPISAGAVPISLTICGRNREIMAEMSSAVSTNGFPVHRLAFDVSLSSFGLTPPAVVGLIRVKDTVHVTADIITHQ